MGVVRNWRPHSAFSYYNKARERSCVWCCRHCLVSSMCVRLCTLLSLSCQSSSLGKQASFSFYKISSLTFAFPSQRFSFSFRYNVRKPRVDTRKAVNFCVKRSLLALSKFLFTSESSLLNASFNNVWLVESCVLIKWSL